MNNYKSKVRDLKYCTQRLRLGDVAVFENRHPVTAAD